MWISREYFESEKITKSPYFCLLDADDYYTDSNFLQRAYDYLEKNKDYVIYYENVKCVFQDGAEKAFISEHASNNSYTINDYFDEKIPIVQTTGQFYRNVIFINGIPKIMEDAVGTEAERSFEGDFDRFIMHLKYGKARFNNLFCGVYRVHPSGIFSGLSKLQKLLCQFQCYYDYNRYFENKYLGWFVGKMYEEFLKIGSCFYETVNILEPLDLSMKQIIQLLALYDFLVKNKEYVSITGVRLKNKNIINKIILLLKKVLCNIKKYLCK